MSVNIELWREAKSTLLWDAVIKELDRRIANALDSLKSVSSDDLQKTQVRITVLEEMKRLPESVVQREEGQEPL